MGAGIQPGKTAPQQLDGQLAIIQIHLVDGRDFQLAAFGGLHPLRVFHNIAVVEIQPGDRPVRFRLFRFFFQRQRLELVIKFHHAKTFRIHHLITKDCRPFTTRCHVTQFRAEALAKEDIVTQYQARRFAVEEGFANNKRLRQPVRAWLFSVL